MKKAMMKSTAVLVLLAMIVVTMVGCGEVNKYKEEAVKKIEVMSETMNAVQTAMTSFDGSEAGLKTITDAVAASKASCQEIIALKAPDKISAEHAMLSESMNSIIGAMDIYATAFANLEAAQTAATDGSLEKAQTMMTEGATKLVEAATALDEIK